MTYQGREKSSVSRRARSGALLDVNVALDEAARLLLQGRTQKVARILRKLLKAEPRNAEALHLAGVARYRTGAIGKACEYIEQAIQIDPDVVDFYVTLGGIHSEAGSLEAAVASYKRAVELDPLDVETNFALANTFRQLSQNVDAIHYYEAALQYAPDNAKILHNLGNALREVGRVDEAIERFQRALDKNPDFIPSYVNLGNVLVRAGRVADAFAIYREGARRKYAPIELDEDIIRKPVQTSTAKLQHDAEQIDYLIKRGAISNHHAEHADIYRKLIDTAPASRALTHSYAMPLPERRIVSQAYNRMIHLGNGSRIESAAVNPELETERIQSEYLNSRPEIVYLDDFLTPDALGQLRDYCLESTIWFSHYDDGYLGAFLNDGFACPLLAQIAEELPKNLPGIFGNHRLRQAWAFKYDSRLSGINLHADFAAVNVNFWITPDSAVEDADTGGLVVWDKEAPADWDFEKFNREPTAMRAFLAENDAEAVRIPYRQNRAVIFNSDLFHETDQIAFRSGYENRRINITLLYGDRDSA
jgi:Tfp pilus assembly protein PilF